MRKILFFGDSISCGVGASSAKERFSTKTADFLRLRGFECEEVNMAVSGSTLIDSGYPVVLSEAIRRNPNVFVIQHGTNDNAIGHSIGKFLWTYRETVRRVKEKLSDSIVVCMTLCPSWAHYRSEHNWHRMVNAGIQEIAAEEEVLSACPFDGIPEPRCFFPDGIHPNDEGHLVMANSLTDALIRNEAPSKGKFTFIANQPGEYRICGYVIRLVPNDKAVGTFTFETSADGVMNYKSSWNAEIFTPRGFLESDYTLMFGAQTQKLSPETFGVCHFHLPACGTASSVKLTGVQ